MRNLMFALALILLLPGVAHAERAYPVKVIWKFGRGVANVVLSPIEIPVNSYKEGTNAAQAGGNLADQCVGIFTGAITGIGYTVARVGVGAADIVTFPIPSRPLMNPGTPNGLLEQILSEDPPTSFQGEAPARRSG